MYRGEKFVAAEPGFDSYALSDGPLPVVRTARSTSDELDLLVKLLKVASREARQGLAGCAVLVPSESAGRALATRLTEAGVSAACMPGRELDLEKPIVKGAQAEETEEALARQRRTMFVTVTRAMRSLPVVPPDKPSPLFEGFDPRVWHVAAPTQVR